MRAILGFLAAIAVVALAACRTVTAPRNCVGFVPETTWTVRGDTTHTFAVIYQCAPQ